MGARNKKKDRIEAKRLGLRGGLADQVIKLPREWQDATNPRNPFALDPHHQWIDEHGGRTTDHPELAWFKWAMVLDDGTLLKAFTRRELLKLRGLMALVEPVVERFPVEQLAVYETPPWKGYEDRNLTLLPAPQPPLPVVLVDGSGGLLEVYNFLVAFAQEDPALLASYRSKGLIEDGVFDAFRARLDAMLEVLVEARGGFPPEAKRELEELRRRHEADLLAARSTQE